MEPHHVVGVIIAGSMPDAEDEKRAFKMYRNAFKDVAVLTFDEVLARLKSLLSYLSPESSETPTAERSLTIDSDDDIPF